MQDLYTVPPYDDNRAVGQRRQGSNHAQGWSESSLMRHQLPASRSEIPPAADNAVAHPSLELVPFQSSGPQLKSEIPVAAGLHAAYQPLTQVPGPNLGMQELTLICPLHGRRAGEGQLQDHKTGQEAGRALRGSSILVYNEPTLFWSQLPGLRDARSKVFLKDAIEPHLRSSDRFYDSQGQHCQKIPESLKSRVHQWTESVPNEGPNGARDIDVLLSDVSSTSPLRRGAEMLQFVSRLISRRRTRS